MPVTSWGVGEGCIQGEAHKGLQINCALILLLCYKPPPKVVV